MKYWLGSGHLPVMQKSILKQPPFKYSLGNWQGSNCQMSRGDWHTEWIAVIQHHLALITPFYNVHLLDVEVALFVLGF